MITDLLDFSEIETGEFKIEQTTVILQQSIDEVFQLLEEKAVAKGLRMASWVDDQVPSTLLGDARHLRQILLNLLTNAIKFTESGSVSVEIEAESETDTQVTLKFSVSDTGIGISADGIQDLYAPFSQVDGSVTREHGGIGLGLAFSKQLVEIMGGTSGVESNVGLGSTFWFTIPLQREWEPEFS